ncbi:MAG: hypothetical protein PHZ19_08230 [Candidatus Thermoplasmatota archaeon]|nr:hypothetical protein [Candidatus Thermoplasmatota archaeon]
MKTFAQALVLVAVGLAVWWSAGGTSGMKRDVERAVVRLTGGPEYVTLTHGIAAGESGRAVVTGAGLRWEATDVGDKTKTQVTDAGAVVHGELRLFNQERYPILISAPTKQIRAFAGGLECVIEDISTSGWGGPDPQPDPPLGTELTFAAYIGILGHMGAMAHEFHYFATDAPTPWNIVLEYAVWALGQELWREESTIFGSGRHGKPVYAKERHMTDEWQAVPDCATWATLGGLSAHLPPGDEYSVPVTSIGLTFIQHKGEGPPDFPETKYAEATVNWSLYPVNFSGRSRTIGIYDFIGDGNAVYLETNTGGVQDRSHAVGHARPYIVDFSRFFLRNRVGALAGDDSIRINGPFQATPLYGPSTTWAANPDGTGTPAYGDKAYPTPAQLRAVGTIVGSGGLITGLDLDDPDYDRNLVTSNVLSFLLTPESLRIAT